MINVLKNTLLVAMLIASPFVRAVVNYPYPENKTIFISQADDEKNLKGSLRIINPDASAWLIQSWAEDEKREKYSVVYPPLTRLEEHGIAALNIYTNHIEKRKINWFVIKIIPSVDKDMINKLAIPIIYRLKIMDKDIEE